MIGMLLLSTPQFEKPAKQNPNALTKKTANPSFWIPPSDPLKNSLVTDRSHSQLGFRRSCIGPWLRCSPVSLGLLQRAKQRICTVHPNFLDGNAFIHFRMGMETFRIGWVSRGIS
jgi:hypothetical protein